MAAVMQAVSLGVGYWASLRSRLRALRAIAVEFLMRHAARRSTAPGPHDCSPASALEPAQPQPTLPNDRRGFARPSPRADIVPAPREASAPAASAGSASHVVGRLSVKARIAAERDLSALLGEVEATEVGRMHRPAFTAIEAVVPHGRYRDLTDGLARIGFWRLEATCFSLPDAVRITIRVSE